MMRPRKSRAGANRRKSFFEPGARFLRMKLKRSQTAAIHDFSGFVQDVNALRPAGINGVGIVGHGIHAERNGEMESLDEIVGDGHALLERLRLRVADTLIEI